MSSQDYQRLSIEQVNGIATLKLEGSNKLNSLDQQTTDELHQVAIDLSEDDSVRCIAIIGAGNVFGGGADLSQLSGDSSDAPVIRKLASTLHEAILQFHQAEKPVVTAVNGVAAGAGFSLALTGDIVLISDKARMEYAYSQIGLTGDGGSTFFLPRLVGLRQAKEIFLRNEPISPDEAVEIGIATEIVPADDLTERLREVAAELASGPTKAFGTTKRLMTKSFERELPTQLAAETQAIAKATRTKDYKRGLAAFRSDEQPDFIGE